MTKKELIGNIALKTGYAKTTITTILESALDSISETVTAGETVYLRGFGSFSPRKHKERIARNIKKMTSVIIPEHMVPHFKPYAEFKDKLNNN